MKKDCTENLQDCQIVTQLSASHGSRFPSALVVRTGNQGLAKRLRASPNRPVWSGAAVQAPKEGRSREATTRYIKGLEHVNSSIYSLAFRTGCCQSVVMHTYTYIKGLALRFRGDSLHSCPQGSEGASVLEGSR